MTLTRQALRRFTWLAFTAMLGIGLAPTVSRALSALHTGHGASMVRTALAAPGHHQVAALGVGAVLLNWITTGDHLAKTLWVGYWPVASVDLIVLAGSGVAARAAVRLRRKAALSAGAGAGTDLSSVDVHDSEAATDGGAETSEKLITTGARHA
ncbi:MAG: hypothetical protein ABL900_18725 [Burkholderiaceae bacterium]